MGVDVCGTTAMRESVRDAECPAVQHESAELKFSMAEEAHVQALEGVGECGAADMLVCSATRGRACVASPGSEARALRGNTPPSRFSCKRFFCA